jgi:hypothetical protein
MMKLLSFVIGLLLAASAAGAAEPAKPLFADDQLIQMTIRAPIGRLASSEDRSRIVDGTLASGAESLPIRLSPRGITRLRKETCQFPPLRVDFSGAPPTASLFAGQRRLKLVTHCRPSEAHQQYVLLEYATYRLYNQLTPVSFRVRLAQIDYVEDGGKPATSRLGFFIEDLGDVAARNAMSEARVGARIPVASLSPAEAARFAVFQYLISNLDWAMQAGPAGDTCCHNSRLLAPAGSAILTTVPYDFDYAGLVDAPYAVPPEGIKVSGIKNRYYRGFCRHNAEALKAAADIRAQRPAMLGVLSQIPQLKEGTRRKATAFLERSFADIATDQAVTQNLLKTCVG